MPENSVWSLPLGLTSPEMHQRCGSGSPKVVQFALSLTFDQGAKKQRSLAKWAIRIAATVVQFALRSNLAKTAIALAGPWCILLYGAG